MKTVPFRGARAALAATASLVIAAPAHGQPGNDHYADAAVIGAPPFADALDVSSATLETAESMPSCVLGASAPARGGEALLGLDDASVWYRFEPADDTTITIDTRGSDFTAAVAVYDGEDLVTQQEVGCARTDDSAVLTVDLAGGRSYALQVVRLFELHGTALSFTIVEGRPDVILPRPPVFPEDASTDAAVGDATVIAIIDTGISPYHWDFLASRMPQALDANPANDLPLDQAPDTWLPGFPDPEAAFRGSYNRVDLALDENDPRRTFNELRAQPADAAKWETIESSTPDAINYYWFPGTKLIGAVTFAPEGRIHEPPEPYGPHGHAVAGSAVGNFVGTCPECLLVFVQIEPAETAEQRNRQFVAALRWALAQSWIDVVSSSQAIVVPLTPGDAVYPDWLDSTFDVDIARTAAERGQTLFQAAGNGLDANFLVPNPTLTNSYMGPDWLVDVGAVAYSGEHVSGAGKPVDIAAPAVNYPISHPDAGIGGHPRRTFGTSLPAPAVAGLYAQALYHARRSLPGPSRTQQDGVVASTEGAFPCGAERTACELADGVLTATELRTRLFHGAVPTDGDTSLANTLRIPAEATAPIADEWRLLNQGHGIYTGRFVPGGAAWLEDLERILAPMEGRATTLDRPDGERDWMIVDSFCRQHLWGAWDGGYFVEGQTVLPGPDAAWPIRTGIETACPFMPDRSASDDPPGNDPQKLEDADPAVEYNRGWHRREDPNASGGGYHRRVGAAGGGEAPTARLVFEGQAVTYFFGRSEQGGAADVFIDGMLATTVDYSGPAPGNTPEFGHSVRFEGLGEGRHEILIAHRSGAIYVDGFEIASDGGPLGAASTRSVTSTALGAAQTVPVGQNDQWLSVVVEGSAAPVTVKLLDPAGGQAAVAGPLVAGAGAVGLDLSPGLTGTYTVQVLDAYGLPAITAISVAREVTRK